MSLFIEGLSKSYGSQKVINHFNLSLSANEILLIQGSSGSGKTTFVRLITNLLAADAGTIKIDDTYLLKEGNYQNSKEYQTLVGLVFQDYQLFPHLNVLDNLILAPLSLGRDSKENLMEQAKSLLKEMDLENFHTVKSDQLSGGQQQRVAIARAMMLQPKLLCFDEPTSALDSLSVKKVAELIESITVDGRMTIVITHDQELVNALEGKARLLASKEFKGSE